MSNLSKNSKIVSNFWQFLLFRIIFVSVAKTYSDFKKYSNDTFASIFATLARWNSRCSVGGSSEPSEPPLATGLLNHHWLTERSTKCLEKIEKEERTYLLQTHFLARPVYYTGLGNHTIQFQAWSNYIFHSRLQLQLLFQIFNYNFNYNYFSKFSITITDSLH